MRVIFWISIGLVLHTYLGYPLSLAVLGWLRPKRKRASKPASALKSVSVIIAAYNEERHILEKINNVLSLDYPPDLVEVLVGSDGSTDRTNEVVAGCRNPRVRLVALPMNRGKTAVQEACVAQARGEIVVFMDAASPCNREALRELVKHFADDEVGCVAGRIVFVPTHGNLIEESQSIYWSYSSLLRHLEGQLGALVGVDGPIYAIRRNTYVSLSPDIMSDFVSPLLVRSQGKKVLYEPGAVAFEEPTGTGRAEFRTRRRIVVRGLHSLRRYPQLLNPFKHPFLAFQLVSHKLLRWLTVVLLVTAVAAATVSWTDPFRGAILAACLALGAAALLGYVLDSAGRALPLLAIPYYFVLGNLAAAAGIWDFIRGRRVISWVPVRH